MLRGWLFKIGVFHFVFLSAISYSFAQPETKALQKIVTSIGGVFGKLASFGGEVSAARVPNNFKKSEFIYQCSSPLTISGLTLGTLSQMTHTWLQIGDQSYGMPYGDGGEVFGGPAKIFSPDPLYRELSSVASCKPIYLPNSINEHELIENYQCVLDKISYKKAAYRTNKDDWYPVFTYHLTQENCLSAVNFMVSCLDGRVSQIPNLGVGGDLDWSREAQIKTYGLGKNFSVSANYSSICYMAKTECGLNND